MKQQFDTSAVYIHGFLSGPQSRKARATQAWLQTQHPQCRFFCPALSSYPGEAREQLIALLDSLPDLPVLIGSSLGGFWATYLVEHGYARRAVLINPAVSPQRRFQDLLGRELRNYYSEQRYKLSERDMDALEAFDCRQLTRKRDFWVWLQAGDEVLDYRDAMGRYWSTRLSVETGGDHSFRGYERRLPAMFDFLFTDTR